MSTEDRDKLWALCVCEALQQALSRFDDHPGISDLDDEQPMHMTCTLGQLRKWRRILSGSMS